MWIELLVSTLISIIVSAIFTVVTYSTIKSNKKELDDKLSNLDAKITNLSQHVTTNYVAGTQFENKTDDIDTRIAGTASNINSLDARVSSFKKTVEAGDYAYNIMRFA